MGQQAQRVSCRANEVLRFAPQSAWLLLRRVFGGHKTILHYAIVFFVIALIAAVFGFSGIAAGAAGIAKILFVVFLVVAVVSLFIGRRRAV
jgi:uncharacterized membrane protein YtjA (UPF0391 family)